VEGGRGVATNELACAIEVRGLTKCYGAVRALDGATFSVGRGEVVAYLGPNGAGKTTTISVFCGLRRRDAGEVTICGADVDRDPVAIKRQIGVVPEESNLYPELTGRRNLEYLGELYGLDRAVRRARADELLETFSLREKAEAPFRTLSRGMKRRLTVAAALVHAPEVLLLDEPTAGLDVPSGRALRRLIQDINRAGATVFLATHNLAEAEALADRVLILLKGRVVAQGTAAEVRRRVGRVRTVTVAFCDPVTEATLRDACPAVRAVSPAQGGWRLEVTDAHAALAELVAFADRQGVRIEAVEAAGASLEEAFLSILDGAARPAEGEG